jgi:hypothetical protein
MKFVKLLSVFLVLILAYNNLLAVSQFELSTLKARGPNTGSGRTLTMPELKTKHFMRLLVQLTKGTA